MKRLLLLIGLIAAMLFAPVAAYGANPGQTTVWEPASTRCAALTSSINALRTPSDLVLLQSLCSAGMSRSLDLVNNVEYCRNIPGRTLSECAARYYTHSAVPYSPFYGPAQPSGLSYATSALGSYCWASVGEVLAQSRQWEDSQFWAQEWWGSPAHQALLNNAAYDRGGGGYTGVSDFTIATYFVVNSC